jgi:hypothetical protein
MGVRLMEVAEEEVEVEEVVNMVDPDMVLDLVWALPLAGLV